MGNKNFFQQLFDASERTGEERWIKITGDVNTAGIITSLLSQGILKKHPTDKSKFTFILFNN